MKKIVGLLALCSTLLLAKGTIEVHGTSTLHDWHMTSNSVAVDMEKNNNKIEKLFVSVIIDTLKSGDEDLDETAYDTLKADPKSAITFELKEHKADGSFDGVFKIGDNEQAVNVMPDSIENGVIKGTLKAKMTSFGIEPPTFLFGAMTTGDEVTVKYTISQ